MIDKMEDELFSPASEKNLVLRVSRKPSIEPPGVLVDRYEFELTDGKGGEF